VKITAACRTAVCGGLDNEVSACGLVDTTAEVSILSLFRNIMCEILENLLNFDNDSPSFYVRKFDHSTTQRLLIYSKYRFQKLHLKVLNPLSANKCIVCGTLRMKAFDKTLRNFS
jgi:hypothetical protein